MGPLLPPREMEIRAGLRWEDGRERIRVRRASPSLKAVFEVKLLKMVEGLDS